MSTHTFQDDKDEARRSKDRARREDRRGTGDEAPEHAPAVVARPEEAGHAPDPQAQSTTRATSTSTQTQREGRRNTAPDAAYHPDPPNHNPARDKGRSLDDEAQILADNLIGQKATAEGTAGQNWTEPPQKHAE